MSHDERLAKLIEGSIPDSLRLAKHPDAELVNLAIATVLAAIEDSSAFTLRGQRKDIRKALETYYESHYAPHIAKEDEDWGSLKARAETAEKLRKHLKEDIREAIAEVRSGEASGEDYSAIDDAACGMDEDCQRPRSE